jgi:hypothetical protein
MAHQPTQMGQAIDWLTIHAGEWGSFIVKKDDSLWMFGTSKSGPWDPEPKKILDSVKRGSQ